MFSLLKFILTELVHTIHMNANLMGIHRVYFCGNFANHEVTRRHITSSFVLRNIFEMNTVRQQYCHSMIEVISFCDYRI